mgnify:CR=1 FL=1
MFKFAHFNFNVLDLKKSIAFYKAALDLEPFREKTADDGSFKLVYLHDKDTSFELELTWLKDRTEKYDLGECEFHLAVATDAMGCVCYDNPGMGIYFITDPDGYWIEIVPA